MVQLTRHSKKVPAIRETACELVSHLPGKAWRLEAETLFQFVRDNVRFVRDISEVETLYTPEQTLAQGYGDCDDMSTLLASLLESIGHKTKFVALGFSAGDYVHVIVQTKLGGKWVSADTTMPHPMGWFPPGVRAIMERYN